MPVKNFRFLILFFIFAAMAGAVTFVYANFYSWTQHVSSTATTNWSDVAISSNGNVLYATRSFDGIYVSVDGGGSWAFINGLPQTDWRSITTSSDGANVIAVANNHDIYYSTDSGNAWNVATVSQNLWVSVASSATGEYAAAVVDGGYIFTSSNYGANWTERTTGITSGGWKSVAMSSGGQYVAAVKTGDYVYTSSDYGATWTAKTGSGVKNFYAIASSADGTKLAAAVFGGYIYVSTDSGTTWTERGSLNDWSSIVFDPNGTRLAATVSTGGIFVSVDGGVTWYEETTGAGSSLWRGIALSESGGKIIAASSNNYLYSATDNIAPTIADITSSLPHGTYGLGEVIDIDLTFSEPVTATDVRLNLNSGGTCTFSITGFSLTAECNYTVASGDSTSDLTVSSISLDGSDIDDVEGNAMTYFVPSVNLDDNKDIVINTTVSSGGGAYNRLTHLNVTVTNATTTVNIPVATSTVPEAPIVIPTPGTIPAVFPPLLTKYEFGKDYKFGDRGIEEIRTLQKFLNYIGFTVSETGPGSKGRETAIFGYFTRRAVIEFQRAYGITPDAGYFGPITRSVINNILSK
jgi:photosystem II stability/assembly factor-like uncharacterized protein